MKRRSTSDPISSKSPLQDSGLNEQIQRRAYDLYEQRGRTDGHDVDDWLRAEAELRGKSKTAVA